jgi:hypothetical protein
MIVFAKNPDFPAAFLKNMAIGGPQSDFLEGARRLSRRFWRLQAGQVIRKRPD